jgi:hypothetical protein
MVRKGFLRFAFIAFLLLALLGMASTTVYRAGWSQGFVSGQVASDGDSEAAPAAPSGYTGRGFGYGFGFLAFCFKGFLMFFFLGILFKFFGFWAWRHGGRRVTTPRRKRMSLIMCKF